MAATTRRFALIPAAGNGMRFGGRIPKIYVELAGGPLLRHTIAAMNGAVVLEAVFVVLAPDDKRYAELIGAIPGVQPLYCGGATRGESVRNGLEAMAKYAAAEDWVLVHDAVRPCIDVPTLNRLQHELVDEPVGGILAIPLADTLKRAESGAGLRVAGTEPRTGLWQAQTPQMFRFAILRHAMRQADVATITDEAQAVEALGVKPRLILGNPANIKVTLEDDLALAEAILAQRPRRK